MKRLFNLIIIFLMSGICCKAQVIKHHHYTVYFNPKIKCADSVVWDLTPQMVHASKVKRKDLFAKDPLLTNSPKPSDFVQLYKDKAHEAAKGHLFSYEDAISDSIDRVECFYMSNMYYQFQSFNAGDWKTVEQYERQLAAKQKIHVIAGYIDTLTHLPSGEIVPKYMYKAIYSNGNWLVWIMPNDITSKGHAVEYWERTPEELFQDVGLKLY